MMTKSELLTLKMNILGGMNEYVKHISNERAYLSWIMIGPPDNCDEEDLLDIASDLDSWRECCGLFQKLVSTYVKKPKDEYTSD